MYALWFLAKYCLGVADSCRTLSSSLHSLPSDLLVYDAAAAFFLLPSAGLFQYYKRKSISHSVPLLSRATFVLHAARAQSVAIVRGVADCTHVANEHCTECFYASLILPPILQLFQHFMAPIGRNACWCGPKCCMRIFLRTFKIFVGIFANCLEVLNLAEVPRHKSYCSRCWVLPSRHAPRNLEPA